MLRIFLIIHKNSITHIFRLNKQFHNKIFSVLLEVIFEGLHSILEFHIKDI